MHIEIEAKMKVDSLGKAARRLKELGAKFLGRCLQSDIYFDDARTTLRKSDSALRIRRSVLRSSGVAAVATEDRQIIGRKEQVVITFKGPKLKGRFKRRQEIQFEVSDARLAEEFFAAIGYKKSLEFQKKRRVWRLGGCEVALDTLPLLGAFVEIEGPGEKEIAAVQKKLGLSHLPHIPESYAVLMQKKLRQLGKTGKEVSF